LRVTSTALPSLESLQARLLGGTGDSSAQCPHVRAVATSDETPQDEGGVAVGANSVQAE
jgi:hypothetical protein